MVRTGRPTDNPKKIQLKVRITSSEKNKLEKCSDALGISQSDVVRKGIDYVYQNISNEK